MTIEITDGLVIRDGKKIGEIEGNDCLLYGKCPPAVKGAINKAHGSKLAFSTQDDTPEPEVPVVQEVATSPMVLSDEELRKALSERGMCIAPIDDPKAIPVPPVDETVSPFEVLQRRATMGQIPPCPPSDAMLGSRTPEVVAWVREHASEADFNAIYGNRKLPTWEEHNREVKRKAKTTLPGEDKPTLF